MQNAHRGAAIFVAIAVLLVAACGADKGAKTQSPKTMPGDAGRGRVAIERFACGACHAIPGIAGADGEIGPSLARIASKQQLAGRLPNTPANLRRWIQEPQKVVPGNGMPNLGIEDGDARDITAYLYTLGR